MACLNFNRIRFDSCQITAQIGSHLLTLVGLKKSQFSDYSVGAEICRRYLLHNKNVYFAIPVFCAGKY